MNLIYIWNNW